MRMLRGAMMPVRCVSVLLAVLAVLLPATAGAASQVTNCTACVNDDTRLFLKEIAKSLPALGPEWDGKLEGNYCADVEGISCRDDGFVWVTCGLYSGSTGSLPELPESVDGARVRLGVLDIRGSAVCGTLPGSWSRLSQLKQLVVAESSVSGTLPASWSALSKLERLYLYQNSLSGTLPPQWSRLSRMGALYLESNKLSGTLPPEWGSLSEVSDLRLSYNSLSGTLPVEWGNMSRLSELYLGFNQLSGELPDWSGMTSMVHLNLQSNQLRGSLRASFAQLPKLEKLILNDNSFCGCVPAAWSGSAVLSTTLDGLGANGEALRAENCSLANSCAVNEDTRRFLKALAAANPSVESGWEGKLDGNYCVDAGSALSCAESGLATLDFSQVKMWATGTLPQLPGDVDGSRVRVEVIEYSSWGLYGSLPGSWGQLSLLRVLDLGSNSLTGSLPASWSQMHSLKEMLLFKNKLSGRIPPEWGYLSSLTTLHIYENQFSGTLPASLGGLLGMVSIDLSDNRLRGELFDVSNMTGLKYFYARNNELTGSLSGSFASLPNLKELYLSGNAFCGCAPKSWFGSAALVSAIEDMSGEAVAMANCSTANACPAVAPWESGSGDSARGAASPVVAVCVNVLFAVLVLLLP